MSSPEITILRALLANESAYISGSDLAQALGMSRVTLWRRMKELGLAPA